MLNIKLDSPRGTVQFDLDEEDCQYMYLIARHVIRNMILVDDGYNVPKRVMSYIGEYAEAEWERLYTERLNTEEK